MFQGLTIIIIAIDVGGLFITSSLYVSLCLHSFHCTSGHLLIVYLLVVGIFIFIHPHAHQEARIIWVVVVPMPPVTRATQINGLLFTLAGNANVDTGQSTDPTGIFNLN